MFKRSRILLGAKTTAGGTVKTASSVMYYEEVSYYILELPGRKIEGVTDADGFTRPLIDAERDALIAWHVEADPAPGA